MESGGFVLWDMLVKFYVSDALLSTKNGQG